MQFTKIVVAISSILAVASATPAPAVKQLGKRSYNNVQQECGNNFKPQCCNNVQFTSFGFFQLPVGAACNDINSEPSCPPSFSLIGQIAVCALKTNEFSCLQKCWGRVQPEGGMLPDRAPGKPLSSVYGMGNDR